MKDFSDVAAWVHGEFDIDYNSVLETMEDEGFMSVETCAATLYPGYGRDYGFGTDLTEWIDAFVAEHGITEVLL